MSILTFGSSEERPRVCKLVTLGVFLKNGQTKHLKVFTVPPICEPLSYQLIAFCQQNYAHLSDLDLADHSDSCSKSDVDILIGSDQYWEVITGKTCRGRGGPVAIHTTLGWVLSGPVCLPTPDRTPRSLVTHALRVDSQSHDTRSLENQLKSFWELEAFGIANPNRSVYEEFGDTIHFVDGRYEVALPWKDPHPLLPDNYQLSLKRLHGLLRRLRQDPDTLKEYDSIIRAQLEQGIVEVVECPEHPDAEKVHYLPHHGVTRHDKQTTKLRIVYDASARFDGPSLNDCLHSGPKFDQRIFDILLRFRAHQVAVTADIEMAFFLMVSVARKDRDVLRFLWVDDLNKDQPDIVVLRFTRVVFGVSSSPFLLNATIRHHLKHYRSTHPDLVHKLSTSTYVDDIVTGASNEEQAYHVYKESKKILEQGGFNLRNFPPIQLICRKESTPKPLTQRVGVSDQSQWKRRMQAPRLGAFKGFVPESRRFLESSGTLSQIDL